MNGRVRVKDCCRRGGLPSKAVCSRRCHASSADVVPKSGRPIIPKQPKCWSEIQVLTRIGGILKRRALQMSLFATGSSQRATGYPKMLAHMNCGNRQTRGSNVWWHELCVSSPCTQQSTITRESNLVSLATSQSRLTNATAAGSTAHRPPNLPGGKPAAMSLVATGATDASGNAYFIVF